jgi:hypothetical protein
MKPKLLLRIAAGCILFFAIGHSAGHFMRHQTTDAREQEVLKMMSENKFDMFGQLRSPDENYTGMSLMLICTLITYFFVILCVANLAGEHKSLAVQLLIPLSLCVLAFSILCFNYFFMVPAVTCLVAFVLMAASIVQLRKS